MSDELKAKLGKIFTGFAGQVYLAASEHRCYPSEQPFITEIHQAYKETGYEKLEDYGLSKTTYPTVNQSAKDSNAFDDLRYMHPSQFLDRFKTELKTMQPLMSPEGYEKFRKAALAVAERAAGK